MSACNCMYSDWRCCRYRTMGCFVPQWNWPYVVPPYAAPVLSSVPDWFGKVQYTAPMIILADVEDTLFDLTGALDGEDE